jgi:hypothetical protein
VRRPALLSLLVLLLASCSSTKTVWSRPGANEMQYKQDSYGCERDQPVIYCGDPIDCHNAKKRLTGMYRRCMESKGWEGREAPKN